ncbi:efflux RND transporter periplasmic adaptor subunit [Agarilytica rhodophyticola]|uniref:efflux RND transporter periplasmic adaptor subunit n=1 Tax=Agarilytica rhodophyticola TaxID=1737490 RepID=UPI001FE65AF4|nr:efflux RND transporter periplasmic adaptor subunit [Agarilytica rhodophyticola]
MSRVIGMQKRCKYMRCAKTIAAMGIFLTLSQLSFAQSVKVMVETVREGSFRDRTEALGTLRANETVELTVNVTESITAIHFEDGQEVKANELLVEMTSSEESALLVEAQTTAFEARRQLDRIQLLVNSGTASESLLDQRTREYEAAQARLIATQSRLKDRIVTAPFDGVVGLRNVSLGALVRPGDIITTLTDSSRMKLDFTVPSVFLPLLKKGLPVVATTRAYRDQEFHGEVAGINNQIDPITRAITVRAILPNDSDMLKPGMLMRIDLSMNERAALVIPEESLIPEGSSNYVLVVNDNDGKPIAEKREVTVASRRVGEVEITQGLQAGERVITHGGFKVKPGSAVQIFETLPNDAKADQPLRAAVKSL